MALYEFPAAGGDGEMAGYTPGKMKRKDLEEVYDEFSFLSPARKIRRLDAELTPIMEEEEESALTHVFGEQLPKEQLRSSSQKMAGGVEPSLTLNKERAIVLYKPVYSPLLDFPPSSDVFLEVDPDVIAGFKTRGLWTGQSNMVEAKEEEAEAPAEVAAPSSCLAVVPWLPSQPSGLPGGSSELGEEAMVSEGVEASSMDVEEEGGWPSGAAPSGMVVTEGFQHWQQHCMAPQISSSNATPIMWSWR